MGDGPHVMARGFSGPTRRKASLSKSKTAQQAVAFDPAIEGKPYNPDATSYQALTAQTTA